MAFETVTNLREFVNEGVLIAMPLNFPGQSMAPPAGETAITCLARDRGGNIYCGTSGSKAHVLAGAIHGDTGAVIDLGIIPSAGGGPAAVLAIAVRPDHLLVLANSGAGSALWSLFLAGEAGCIQEWSGFGRHVPKKVCDLFPEQTVATVAVDVDGERFWGIRRDGVLFSVDWANNQVQEIGSVRPTYQGEHYGDFGALALDSLGRVWGTCEPARLWVHDPQVKGITQTHVHIPFAAGRPRHTQVSAWTLDSVSGRLFGGTTPDGYLFILDPGDRGQQPRVTSLGKPCRLDEINCLTVANDGRLLGMAGREDDVGHLFSYDPSSGAMADLGVPTAVLGARQYGYYFRCAMTGPGGEIYFGQHERVNHLWVYFPPQPRRETPVPY